MPVERLFIYSFDNGRDEVYLPADEGAWSLEGFAHAARLTAHYFVEGKIRRRAPYSDEFRILIAPPRAGSWVADFIIEFTKPDIWAGGVAGFALGGVPGVFRMLRRLASRATGQEPESDGSEQFEEAHSGTFDALVEAVEPSLARAHKVIRDHKTTVTASLGRLSFSFDQHTREYIETSVIDPGASQAVGNVGSYNVNNRTGRMYFNNLGRTIPFSLHRDVDQETEIALGRSLQNYTENRLANDDIRIQYRAVRAADGRIKRIVINRAVFLFEKL